VTSNYDEASKKIKELEKQVVDSEGEIAKLNIQLTSAQASCKQYMELATGSETQLQTLLEEHHKCAFDLKEKLVLSNVGYVL